jgi:hypothetical protein
MGGVRRMPRACRGMKHVRAGARIHGEVCQRIGYGVHPHVVMPVAHLKEGRRGAAPSSTGGAAESSGAADSPGAGEG